MSSGTELKFLLFIFDCYMTCNAGFRHATTDSVKNVKVDRVERAGENNSRYKVFTEDEVFEVTDDFSRFHFTADDVYAEIKVDSVYNFKVNKKRWPIISMNRNIFEVEKIPQPAAKAPQLLGN